MRKLIASLAFVCAVAAPALAQTKPVWTGEGVLGAGLTTGNTETTDVAAALKLKHDDGGEWTQAIELAADYGETNSVETKNRLAAAGQVDRVLDERMSIYGRATFERDEFSGFENRYFVGAGVDYKFIVSEPTNWTLSAGPGYRVDEIRLTGESEESFGASLGSRFSQALNPTTQLTNDTDVIYADTSTQIVNSLALTFELMGNLNGRVSYDVRYETDPPVGFEDTDTALRFSLVYKVS